MRFNVPKFVTIEDKILIGPVGVTIRQLFLLFCAFLISYSAYKIFSGVIFLIVFFISFGLAIVLGWFKINNKYVISFLPKLIKILISNRRFVWKEEIAVMNKITKIPEIKNYIQLIEEELNKNPLPKDQEKDIFHLSKLMQFAHKHGYNPKDPYLNFPLPRFPKNKS